MATAMHRIASTGSQEAADREWVISNLRFQQLVFDVEHALEKAPQTFGEQHLANVVWGAAKLRLRKEALFYLVHHEVLSLSLFLSRVLVLTLLCCCPRPCARLLPCLSCCLQCARPNCDEHRARSCVCADTCMRESLSQR